MRGGSMKLDLEEIKRICTEYLPSVPAYELAKALWEKIKPLLKEIEDV
jgi:hypothetical protein